jgi:hypothetical protein
MRYVTASFALLLCAGCGDDGMVISDANADCAAAASHCTDKVASGILFLDTGNLPSALGDPTLLRLCATQPVGACEGDGLDLIFEGGPLTGAIDPGFADEAGWKLRFRGAAVDWVDPPGTIRLRARLRDLDFVLDRDGEHEPALKLE